MGSCIICGTSVEGRICDLHEEDALFEFRGDNADQLTTDRYYRGTVDGFAEFGVFIDIGDSVTGLLHRSELDQRLDSLDWESGDEVYVQVKNVRDNGNVDLGWSIRQADREFRGVLVDDPDIGHSTLLDDESAGNADGDGRSAQSPDSGEQRDTSASDSTDGSADTGDEPATGTVSQTGDADRVDTAGGTVGAVEETASTGGNEQRDLTERERATIGSLSDMIGETVRLDGEVANIRQTSGPTVFTLKDETGTVDCAAFVEAGVRAYPDVIEGDIIRLGGEVQKRRGEIQVETETLTVLNGDDLTAVERRLEDALDDKARPDAADLIADDPALSGLSDSFVDAATQIRKAVLTDRPVIVRHANTADGYLAGSALERATLPLVTDQHRRADAKYHYFDRRPLEGGVYDMDDATKDTSMMLDNRERHDETLPLFVFVGAGGTRESLDGFDLLTVYGAPTVVIDDIDGDGAVTDAVDAVVSPSGDGTSATTATTLATNVAAHVNDDARDAIGHLPAVSFWDACPDAYLELAYASGYDDEAITDLREAVALEAHYQSYEDKRELITDLVFGDEETDVGGLAGHIAEQFREKVDNEIETAKANLDYRTIEGQEIAVLDTEAYSHQYEFPPETLLLDELHRDMREAVDGVLGIATDTLYVRTDAEIDMHELAGAIHDDVPAGGVTTRSVREGSLTYLTGERSAVVEATLSAIAERL